MKTKGKVPAPMPRLEKPQQDLVLSVTRMCNKLAQEWATRAKFSGSSYYAIIDDYTAAAYMGACIAASRYDATRGAKFSTFAWPWIINRLQNEARHRHPLGSLWMDRESMRANVEIELHQISKSREAEIAVAVEADQQPEEREIHDAVRSALKGMSKEERDLLLGRFHENKPFSRLANTRQAAHAAINKALAKLKKKIRRRMPMLVAEMDSPAP